MTTYQTPIVAGVFKDEMEARKAVDMLRHAQFERDQLGVAMRDGGTATESLSNDFMNLGVPHDRANFYEHEFKAGKIVVSVRADGRDDEARTILNSNGAYDYDAIIPAPLAPTEPQSTDQPALNAQTVQTVQQPSEQDQPAHENLAQPTEDDAIQESTDLNPSDSHAQIEDAEHPTDEPGTDIHDQSQVADPQAHSAETGTISSTDTTHDSNDA
jgi:hypothetical protein